jgi:hypothetical protein
MKQGCKALKSPKGRIMWPTLEQNQLVDDKLGTGFNELPPNTTKISESEFYWRWSIRPARSYYQYRQVRLGPKNYPCSVSLFVHPGDFSGIGHWIEYDGRATRAEIDAYKPHYFKWHICEHDFETITSRMNYWEGRCTKCGYEKAIDSSG